MDHILTRSIEPLVPLESRGARDVRVVRVLVVDLTLDEGNGESDDCTDDRHDHVDSHRELNLQADVDEPHRHVVVERALEMLCDLAREMLRQVCIDE